MPMAMWYAFLLPLTTALAAMAPVAALTALVFYPREPRTLAGVRLHGLLPARRQRLARLVWDGVRREISQGAVGARLCSPEMAEQVSGSLTQALDRELQGLFDSAPGLVAGLLRERLGPAILERADAVLRRQTPGLSADLLARLMEDRELDAAVPQALERFMAEDLEPEARRTLTRVVPWLLAAAGSLGFVLGLFQCLLVGMC